MIPSILVADDWRDYRLLDSGEGQKLEQVGPYRFVRPEPQALWAPMKPKNVWARADAVFAPTASEDEDSGRWKLNRELPAHWEMVWDDIRFLSRPTPFRHLAFFPEHSSHWRYARAMIAARGRSTQAEVLNLFGYTGLASLACASAGAKVTHVDASKRAIGFARENQAHAGMGEAPIRWICDDALTFVQREVRRGRRYDGIILDPPKFGRGPNGEVWRLEAQLPELLSTCRALVSNERGASGFIIVTVYAVRLSFIALAQLAQQVFDGAGGEWEFGEMALPHADDARLLPTAIFARWNG